MPAEIRKMTLGDVDGVMEIENACFSAEAWRREDFEAAASEDGVITSLVCEIDGETAGYACGACVLGELEIYSVAVKKEYRRRGAAKALIKRLEEIYRPDAAFLEVRESNIAARSLYGAIGFEEYGLRKSYYSSPEEDAVLMKKTYR